MKKGALVTGITVTASVCSILGFLIANGHSSSSSAPNPPLPSVAVAYPVADQQAYMQGCTGSGGSEAQCGCTLTWFEQHVSLAQFLQDNQEASEGITPPDETSAVAACE